MSLFQTLYSLLPALLDTNPFSTEEKKRGKAGAKDRAGGGGEGDEEEDVSALPPTVAGLVEVYRCSLQLSREACLSPPLTSQTFGYLFFFTNTSLLNTLLERGENVVFHKHCLCVFGAAMTALDRSDSNRTRWQKADVWCC